MNDNSVEALIAHRSLSETQASRSKFQKSYFVEYFHDETLASDPFSTAISWLKLGVLHNRMTKVSADLGYAVNRNSQYISLVKSMNEFSEKMHVERDQARADDNFFQFDDWLPHWNTVLEWENIVRSIFLTKARETLGNRNLKVVEFMLDERLSLITALDSLRKDYTTTHRLIQAHYRLVYRESIFTTSLDRTGQNLMHELASELKPYRNQYFLDPTPDCAKAYVRAVNNRFNPNLFRASLSKRDSDETDLMRERLNGLESLLVDTEVELMLDSKLEVSNNG